MRKHNRDLLDNIAKDNNYDDKTSLLMDYGFIPTVVMPKHKKIEIVPLAIKAISTKRNKED